MSGNPTRRLGGLPFTDVGPTTTSMWLLATSTARTIPPAMRTTPSAPHSNVTRGLLSNITVLARGWTLECPTAGHFTDVPSNNAFYCFVETAFAHGIISSYSDGTFRPGNNVTRGQISVINYRAITGP